MGKGNNRVIGVTTRHQTKVHFEEWGVEISKKVDSGKLGGIEGQDLGDYMVPHLGAISGYITLTSKDPSLFIYPFLPSKFKNQVSIPETDYFSFTIHHGIVFF